MPKPESTIDLYNQALPPSDKAICDALRKTIDENLPQATSKIWHAHPVWFLDGNPIVGYSKQKAGIRLIFWSGVGFNEAGLTPGTGKYKDASAFYNDPQEINTADLNIWLTKSKTIQWDYKNIVKRRGVLERLK